MQKKRSYNGIVQNLWADHECHPYMKTFVYRAFYQMPLMSPDRTA